MHIPIGLEHKGELHHIPSIVTYKKKKPNEVRAAILSKARHAQTCRERFVNNHLCKL